MKGIKRIIFVFSLLMFIPNMVKAECDFNEKRKLQSLASNLNFTYNYKQLNDDEQYPGVEFSITITNFQPDLYIVDQSTSKTYNYNGNNEITIDGYADGSSIKFAVYANSGTCKGEHLITNYVSLPPYNRYYNAYVCKDVTDYALCERWSRVSLSYDTFAKKVTKYKESLAKNNDNDDLNDDLIEKIINFLSKYSFYLFGGIIIVCGGLIYYLDKKNSFDLK